MCPICLLYRFIKPYLQICPENVFVVEDEYGLCGYAVATTDAKQFYEQCKAECLPEVRMNYHNNFIVISYWG